MNEISLITTENIEVLKEKEKHIDNFQNALALSSSFIGSSAIVCFSLRLFMNKTLEANTFSILGLFGMFFFAFVFLVLFFGFTTINFRIKYKIKDRITPKSKMFFKEIEDYVEETLKIENASFEEIENLLSKQNLCVKSANFVRGSDKEKALDDLSIVGVHLSKLIVKNNVFQNYALLALAHPFGKRYEIILKNMFDYLYTENMKFKDATGEYLYQSENTILKGDEFYQNPIDIFEGQKIKLETEKNIFRCVFVKNILQLAYYEYYILHKDEITQTKYNISKLVPILEERQILNSENKEDLINKLFFI